MSDYLDAVINNLIAFHVFCSVHWKIPGNIFSFCLLKSLFIVHIFIRSLIFLHYISWYFPLDLSSVQSLGLFDSWNILDLLVFIITSVCHLLYTSFLYIILNRLLHFVPLTIVLCWQLRRNNLK
jgi:hypothetical protein